VHFVKKSVANLAEPTASETQFSPVVNISITGRYLIPT
jgi:hypothetical protein